MNSVTTYFQRVRRSAMPHVTIELYPQSTNGLFASSKIPVEILEKIFSVIGTTEQDFFLESSQFGPPHLRTVLLRLAQVCKMWSAVANEMLYRRSYVSSHESLTLFLRELRRRESTRGLVRSFTFFPPLTQLDPKGKAERSRQETRHLLEAVKLCPESTRLHLKTTHIQISYLLTLNEFRTANIMTLHVSQPGAEKLALQLPHNFPSLRTLVLQRFLIVRAASWPITPQLESLRLIDTNLIISDSEGANTPFSVPNLRRLELINVHYTGDRLLTLLSQSAGTLEYLSMINVGGPDIAAQLGGLGFLHHLHSLCIGPKAFPVMPSGAPPRFPLSLMHLTIWELLSPKNVDGTLQTTVTNYDGLQRFLTTSQETTPNLELIRIRGAERDWAPRKKDLGAMCKVDGGMEIKLELSLFKFEMLPVEDLAWKKRTWEVIKTKVDNW